MGSEPMGILNLPALVLAWWHGGDVKREDEAVRAERQAFDPRAEMGTQEEGGQRRWTGGAGFQGAFTWVHPNPASPPPHPQPGLSLGPGLPALVWGRAPTGIPSLAHHALVTAERFCGGAGRGSRLGPGSPGPQLSCK